MVADSASVMEDGRRNPPELESTVTSVDSLSWFGIRQVLRRTLGMQSFLQSQIFHNCLQPRRARSPGESAAWRLVLCIGIGIVLVALVGSVIQDNSEDTTFLVCLKLDCNRFPSSIFARK